MTTAGEVLARVRAICLALPSTTETLTWGEPHFRVQGKIFAGCGGSTLSVGCKVTKPHQAALVKRRGFAVAPYVGKHGWVAIDPRLVTDWDEIAELLRISYGLIAPRKLAAAVAAPAPRLRWFPPSPRKPAKDAFRLTRRGVAHGWLVTAPTPDGLPADAAERWTACRPIVWRGALRDRLAGHVTAMRRTLAWFEKLRRGERFLRGVQSRMRESDEFAPAGTTVDAADPREIEKVWVDHVRGARTLARDLWAKLAWIAHDESDPSLRIRFSWGSEALREWHTKPARFPHVDAFASALFPECSVMAECRPLLTTIGKLRGGPVRLSERIVYNNFPGGGAVFHHDAEPTQLGVSFAQLAGRTAWLALPRKELAAAVAEARRGITRRRADKALDDTDEPKLYELLNHTAEFTRRLHDKGALFVLDPGDVVLLPTVPGTDTCWHSVFGIGEEPSLAHSYGIFARGRKGP